jgi:phytoene synthase
MGNARDDIVNDQLFCWEQTANARPLFRMTRVFAPAGLRDRLLPLHALLAAIESTCSRYSDEDLARSKLHWWRAQLLEQEPSDNPHPVMRELVRTGAAERLPADQVQALLSAAEDRLDAAAPADLDALLNHCRDLQQPQRLLEMAVTGLSPEELPSMARADAMAGLLQLLRESVRRPRQDAYWWLPLQLLARHGLARDAVSDSDESGRIESLFRDLVAAVDRPDAESALAPEGGNGGPAAARHLAVGLVLGARKLRRLPALAPALWPGELSGTRLGDLFAAWRTARRYTA